ncbi:hypothetical protein AYL99_01930 [Fonsecaea erecta]|uniref:Uncharacterized protein n=1 Tax=Fonsecaea erecta TaxID=1367422 RepID=A0A178ZU10_9EURO|nr:hypothetical protein AYL99_01930 [Fonsecaea erecta]OAP62703.1 hypothetical protein AYL99_01930 [Fonsecaea erecta]
MSRNMSRRPTGDSSHGLSLGRRLIQPFSQQGSREEPKYRLYPESYGVYNGMTWEKLKGFLERRFPQSAYPGLEFHEDRTRDHWIFAVPEPLNDEDKRELLKLRDSHLQPPATSQAQGRRSVSPE